MSVVISIHVLYSQIAVFLPSMAQPFNDWEPRHVTQGFAWRLGSVSFRTLVETGLHRIEIERVQHIGEVCENALRVVEVPFEVPEGGEIEIGSITETFPVFIQPGKYRLRCEFMGFDDVLEAVARLTFAVDDSPTFNIVVADSELKYEGDLLTEANPALF